MRRMMEQSTWVIYSGVGVVIVVIAFLLLARRKPAVAMAPAMSAAAPADRRWRCSGRAGAPYGGGTRAEPGVIAPRFAKRIKGAFK